MFRGPRSVPGRLPVCWFSLCEPYEPRLVDFVGFCIVSLIPLAPTILFFHINTMQVLLQSYNSVVELEIRDGDTSETLLLYRTV